jgi:hypothetical protein
LRAAFAGETAPVPARLRVARLVESHDRQRWCWTQKRRLPLL